MSLSFLARVVERTRGTPLTPHRGPVAAADEPMSGTGKSGALRAAVFGVNDGLVSNLSLIMGVAGSEVGRTVIVVAGIAGLMAGAFSMAAGEYISMRVQRELFERLLHLEAHELAADPEGEHRELVAIYRQKGMPAKVAEEASEAVMRDPRRALETHAREELGLDPDALGSPWAAAGSSFLTFALGAFVPLAPFLVAEGTAPVLVAIAAGGSALFLVGALMSRLTGRGGLWSGTRMVLLGAAAAAVTFGVGKLLHVGGVTG